MKSELKRKSHENPEIDIKDSKIGTLYEVVTGPSTGTIVTKIWSDNGVYRFVCLNSPIMNFIPFQSTWTFHEGQAINSMFRLRALRAGDCVILENQFLYGFDILASFGQAVLCTNKS